MLLFCHKLLIWLNNTTACSDWRRGRVGGRENHEQEEDTRKRQILGTIEGMHSRRKYVGEQEKPEECNEASSIMKQPGSKIVQLKI